MLLIFKAGKEAPKDKRLSANEQGKCLVEFLFLSDSYRSPLKKEMAQQGRKVRQSLYSNMTTSLFVFPKCDVKVLIHIYFAEGLKTSASPKPILKTGGAEARSWLLMSGKV